MQPEFEFDATTVLNKGQRTYQEDAIIADFARGAEMGLAVLADGMGGHAAGDIASKIVVSEVFSELLFQRCDLQAFERDARHVLIKHDPSGAITFLDRLPFPRRPRIALMGEFSAGKSTLANLMIGTDPLPMQVVATQLPPVWIGFGTANPTVVDFQGQETDCDLDTVSQMDPMQVAFIRLQCEEKILEKCDIIDMPGISDPNTSSETWERVLPAADGVVWCSAATQAWRQSEAAVWETVDETIKRHSMLLLTRSDMLLTQRDRDRVLERVRTETLGSFRQTQMISLLEARDAVEDRVLWVSSGAEAFVNGFLSLVRDIEGSFETAACEERNARDDMVRHQLIADLPKDSAQRDKVLPRRPIRKTVTRQGSSLDPKAPDSFTPKFS